MIEHMTLVTTAAFLCGGAAGALTLGFFASMKHDRLRKALAAKDDQISGFITAQSDNYQELTTLGTRCSELRVENRNKDQANEKLVARIRDLEPLADAHRATLAQRQKALDAARAANTARAAAKASNVAPIKKRA